MRSLLLTAASRPDLFQKVGKFDADVTVIDLEDATHPDDKARARESLIDAISEPSIGWNSTYVRVNDLDSELFELDIKAVVDSSLDGLVLPKVESSAVLKDCIHLLTELETERGADPLDLIIGLESVAGVHNAFELVTVSERIRGAYFGAEDYIKDIGGVRSPSNMEVLYARSKVVAAAHQAGVWPIDQVVMDLKNDDRFLQDAFEGRGLGYRGKLCAHAGQVALAHDVFPSTIQKAEPSYVQGL